ncbi:MAG: adenosyl-hopene transferase HpnH [Thermoleophilia bacterium]|nr:adenosyl-hopene transferase HpnH [Thermoleophilia bacterium]
MVKRPVALELGMATYLLRKRLVRRNERFPFTLMLEPLELCNLACHGCGRIREYAEVFHKRLSVEECLRVAEECGAPIVNIPGGEPLIHKQIDQIVNGITAQGRFVYLCTNGILMPRAFGRIPPSNRFAFVVHIDGMEAVHDHAVDRRGVFAKATEHMREAIARGYRVCTNTTIFRGTPPEEYLELFMFLKDMGVEGCITSPGFDYESVTHDREQFLARREAQALYGEVHARCEGLDVPFYNNPLFHEFLQGKREYRCSAWAMPTYTVEGWRSPCYLLADKHVGSMRELYEGTDWEAYGTGRDPRCANCLMHCGYEASTILDAMSRPRDLIALARG